MAEIGIRDLKAQASRVLEEVRSRGARYVITKRGRPVGVLLPLESGEARSGPAVENPSTWEDLDRLGEEIGRGWRQDRTTGEILDEIRS